MPRYSEVEVVLQNTHPRIWRQLRIRTTATFAQLHMAIQDSFGWRECHLWEFRLPTHDVKLVAVRSDRESFKRRLLDGERSAPPEDCGGTSGYERMVHYLETGEDLYGDDAVDLGAWLDGWRPDGFDLAHAKAEFDR